MKKWIFIVLGVFVILLAGSTFWYTSMLKPVTGDKITFVVEPGMNKIEIVTNLKNAGAIRSKLAGLIYVFTTPKLNLQAGTYEISKDNSTKDILKQISDGKIIPINSVVRITFVEGKRLNEYAKQISENFDISYDDFIAKASDKEFLKELIKDYWFLEDDILDDRLYFPLEGYLFPSTYEFYENANAEVIIRKMLSEMGKNLEPYKEQIDFSEMSAHEYLAAASIIEKEAVSSDDRKKVSQVIYTRLDFDMSLGMDVTTYYGAMKEMGEDIVPYLQDDNPYNTRRTGFKGLPAGAICSPSADAINAVFSPSNTNYLYFVADVNTGKVYFAENEEEFLNFKNLYM